MTFISLLFVITCFPYNKTISNPFFAIVLAVVCAFAPFSVGTFIVIVLCLFELMSLSIEIAGAALLFIILSYIIAGVYRSKMVPAFVVQPTLYRINLPFILPLLTALFGKKRDASAVIMGSVLTYFFSAIYKNSALIKDESNPISAIDLITREMISAPIFYVFIISIVVMFVVTYSLRSLALENGFLFSILFGVLSEFSIMLFGCLFFSESSEIPVLIVSNLITLLAGIVSVLLFRDLDYTRIERTKFEDDDYYYYVTAVPKIKLAHEKTVVKDITKHTKKSGAEEDDSEQDESDWEETDS